METTLGEIITFYSYKGGTGRSMALANVACLLAQKQDVGKGVLMIDWDLEAPGLHQFFHGKFENTRDGEGDLPSGQLGLIDLFYEIRNRLVKSKSQENLPEDIFSAIDIQKYIVKVNQSSLFLMPAGKFDDGVYSARVNEFDWADFFSDFPSVITQFAQYLRRKYKYVLIDSRTGYTDISGICTSIMPEKLVTVFTPNRQSISGIVEMIKRATDYRKQSDDLRPLMIFPLPSRVETGENVLQKEWRFGNAEHEGYQIQITNIFKEVYDFEKCDLTNYFDKYKLQYIPRYSYGEEVAVLSERSEDRLSLAYSFENFSNKLISLESPWEEPKDELFEENEDAVVIDEFSKAKVNERRKLYIRTALSIFGVIGSVVAFIYLYPYISPYINSVFVVTIIVLLGLSKDLRNRAVYQVIELLYSLVRAGNVLKNDFLARLSPYAFSKFINPNDLQYSFSEVFKSTNKFFESAIYSLREHAFQITNKLEPDDNLRTWRIFGYFFQFVFLCLFAYADLIQLGNNLAVIFPNDISLLNPLYDNLSFSLLITSVGTAVASSFIISDFSGITNFGRWNEIKSPYLRKSIYFLTWFALAFIILIGTIIAIARITDSSEVATLLSVQTSNSLIILANIAQTLIIIPLFIMTFLFLGGIVGIAVFYALCVWLLSFFVQIIQVSFITIFWLLIFGISYMIQLVSRVITWFLVISLFVFGWLFYGIGSTSVKILEVFHKLLDIFYFPMDAIINWLISYLNVNKSEEI